MGTENNSYVQFKDIQKSYDGETLVIKGLNLDVACGEFLTLLDVKQTMTGLRGPLKAQGSASAKNKFLSLIFK